jgi:hypothetical protein
MAVTPHARFSVHDFVPGCGLVQRDRPTVFLQKRALPSPRSALSVGCRGETGCRTGQAVALHLRVNNHAQSV